MARSRENVSPKISSHSAGWIARVYSSVRSCRIFWSSTMHIATTRAGRRRQVIQDGGSAEPAGGTAGAARVTEVVSWFVELVAGVGAEHLLESRPGLEPRLQFRRCAERPDPASVHEGDPVAVLVGLVHVVGGHQDGHARRPAYLLDPVPDAV